MKRLWKRVSSLLLAALMMASLLAVPVLAVTQAEIDALKKDSKSLDSRMKELEEELKQLGSDKAEAINRKSILDQKIAVMVSDINNTQAQIDGYTELIAQAEADLADAQAQEEDQYALFCRRVRAMEERGTISYWSVLFKARSYSDLLGRLDAVNEIMNADQAVIDKLEALQEEISDRQASLESAKADSEAAKADLVTKKAALDQQRAAANQLIKELADNEDATEAALDEMEKEEEQLQAKIKQLEKKLAEEMAARGQSFNSNPGGYIWPVSSRYITSTVGGRTSPGGIGSTNHKGTDIGRVGYTSPIYAAKSGTVIVAERSRSYGNYVVISHGSGNTTLYGHMSSIKTTVGQYVQQGQVIGITGSTGNSTGPHLHFEIVENGVRINPLSDHGAEPRKGYLTGYTLSKSA